MTELELFLILFTSNYLKEILIPEINKLMTHPMELGGDLLGCWDACSAWVPGSEFQIGGAGG